MGALLRFTLAIIDKPPSAKLAPGQMDTDSQVPIAARYL